MSADNPTNVNPTSLDAAVRWAIDWVRANAADVRPGDAGQMNAALHHAAGVEKPCESACSHVLFDEWTALGLANVTSRHAWRFT